MVSHLAAVSTRIHGGVDAAPWPLHAGLHPAAVSPVKRLLDVAVSGVLLVLLSPLLFMVAAVVRLTSRGPALFVQPRVGYGGELFPMFKFRTMMAEAELSESELARRQRQRGFFKVLDDPRLTPVGRSLRRYSLDELPQLLNVLRGDMSLVGPRPLLLREVQALTPRLPASRFAVRPGMTGLWQVSGRSLCTDDERIRYDADYVDGWSLAGDLRLLARTLPAVISGRGAC